MAISPILLSQYAIPIVLPLLLFLFFLLKNTLSSSTKKTNIKNLPPSPPALPIIGNLHQLSKLPHHSLRSLSQKYGDVMLLQLGSKPVVVVSSAETALQVMKTHDLIFCSRPQWKIITRFLNDGKDMISTPYGEYWRNMRSVCVLELLSKNKVESFSKVRMEEVNLVVKSIRHMRGQVNMRQVFTSLSNDLMARVALGRKLKGEGDEADYEVDFQKVLEEGSELIGRFSVGEFVPCLAWIDKFTGVTPRMNKVIKMLDDFLEEVLAEHSTYRRKGNEENCTTKDFVDVLLEVQKGGDTAGYRPIDRESVKGLLLDMFIAGVETTSNAMEWMMSEMLRCPIVMEKLQQEVSRLAKGKEVIGEDDLTDMVYLKATIKETLRLHPPSPLLTPREAMQDAEINGYHIDVGTMVLINGWAIGRDPKYWEEADEFIPERFLDPPLGVKENEFRMIPFGSGRRGCPGELFGAIIMELTMANLLLHFNWTLPLGVKRETLDMTESIGMASHRNTPLVVVAIPKCPIILGEKP